MGGDFDKVTDELLTRGKGGRSAKKGGGGGEKKTRRRNKMSAALVSCDAAGNASAGTVYEQTGALRDVCAIHSR